MPYVKQNKHHLQTTATERQSTQMWNGLASEITQFITIVKR